MTMEAGFSSYAVGWATEKRPGAAALLDAGGVVDLAAELSYRRVQLADNVPLHALGPGDRADLLRRARRANVTIEVGARGLTSDNVSTYVGIAAEFGSPFLRLVIDALGCEPEPDAVIEFLRAHVSLFRKSGVVLALENHDRFPARELARIVAAVDSRWVAICLDTANSIGAGEDIYTVVHSLARYAVNIHLKDVRIRRLPHLQGFTVEGTPLGEGRIPFAWALEQVAQHGRCLTATLEHWVPPEPEYADTVRKEREWCDRSTAVMRRLFPGSFSPTRR